MFTWSVGRVLAAVFMDTHAMKYMVSILIIPSEMVSDLSPGAVLDTLWCPKSSSTVFSKVVDVVESK